MQNLSCWKPKLEAKLDPSGRIISVFLILRRKYHGKKKKHEETYVWKSNLDSLKNFWSNEMVF